MCVRVCVGEGREGGLRGGWLAACSHTSRWRETKTLIGRPASRVPPHRPSVCVVRSDACSADALCTHFFPLPPHSTTASAPSLDPAPPKRAGADFFLPASEKRARLKAEATAAASRRASAPAADGAASMTVRSAPPPPPPATKKAAFFMTRAEKAEAALHAARADAATTVAALAAASAASAAAGRGRPPKPAPHRRRGRRQGCASGQRGGQ